jgi:hypothetical protein
VIDGQFVVQALSTARLREVESLMDSYRSIRSALRTQGVLVPFGHLLRFTQDYAFDSPSGAATVVAGTTLNGRTAWKVKGTDLTYKEWQERQVAASERAANVG